MVSDQPSDNAMLRFGVTPFLRLLTKNYICHSGHHSYPLLLCMGTNQVGLAGMLKGVQGSLAHKSENVYNPGLRDL